MTTSNIHNVIDYNIGTIGLVQKQLKVAPYGFYKNYLTYDK